MKDSSALRPYSAGYLSRHLICTRGHLTLATHRVSKAGLLPSDDIPGDRALNLPFGCNNGIAAANSAHQPRYL